jgi:pyruvate formate lyase activating enzyme
MTKPQVDRSPVYGARTQTTMVDFPGRIAGVVFTTGCNFQCGFCHNATLLQKQRPGYTWDKLRQICERFRGQWATGVVITGGEPTLAPGIEETVAFFREQGLAVKLDSNGSRPEMLERLLPMVDYVAMDIKTGLDRYHDFVQYPHTHHIEASIRLIMEQAKDYEFRTTVIEDVHTEDEAHRVGKLIAGAKRHYSQAFVPREDLPDPELAKKPRTNPDVVRAFSHVLGKYVEISEARNA